MLAFVGTAAATAVAIVADDGAATAAAIVAALGAATAAAMSELDGPIPLGNTFDPISYIPLSLVVI
jgi:hypothetical protein